MFKFFKKSYSLSKQQNNSSIVPAKKEALMKKGPTLHEDLKGLIWIADGPYKNYSHESTDENTINLDYITITISFLGQEEPSLIYTSQKIKEPEDISMVERPPYYPNYSVLTPEQKWVYFNLLTNPYDKTIDTGYVFILYYGLERHLLKGNYEKAFRTILKLRDVHTNKSFQFYSANALILSAMLHKRGDLAIEFIESLDKEYEFQFSDNLFLICYYSFDIPIKSDDIIRMAKSFNFTNMNYIKKYPDVFIDVLRSILLEKNGTDGILLKNILSETELSKIHSTKQRIFANMSIVDEEIPVPQLVKCKTLKDEMFSLLETAHNRVKSYLAERRKAGKPLPSKKELKPKKQLVFDEAQEASLLRDLKKSSNNLVNKHFIYIYLQNFYYKYRGLDNKYIEKCKEYCLLDINSLEEMFAEYIQQEIDRTKQLKDIYGEKETKEKINEVKEQGFIGNIPAFSRLSIIYENEGNIIEAIKICNHAIALKQSEEYFKNHIKKLKLKQDK